MKEPITYWFKAMWWFTTRKSCVNAIKLQAHLGCSHVTAWSWLQKFRQCNDRKDREKLSNKVEVDEFFIGGLKPGKGAADPMVEQLWQSPLKDSICESGRGVFACMSSWIVRTIHQRRSSSTILNPVPRLRSNTKNLK